MKNTVARFRKIERTLSKNYGQLETVVLKDYGGKYYLEKDGKNVEIKNPNECYPDKQLVIVTMYSNYAMPKDID